MIQRIEVKGLFGLYDYDITFSTSPAVKLLTGPNGYGKTTLLKVVDHLFRSNFWYFHFLNFELFIINLQKQKIVIEKKPTIRSGVSDENQPDATDDHIYEEFFNLVDSDGNTVESVVLGEDYIQKQLTMIRRKVSRETLALSDIELFEYFYVSYDDDYVPTHSRNISLALQEYTTRYLPAQRLFTYDYLTLPFRFSRMYSYEIDHVNDEVCKLYKRTQNLFASDSQRIDATYISRLMKRHDDDYYTQEELKMRLDMLKQRIDGYKELNLISNMEILDSSLNDEKSYEEFKKVLSLYVDDMNDKMGRFDQLYKKMSLFKQVVTDKVLSEKTIDFSDNGMKITNVNGRVLPDLHKLSSGEQNLLILYFNLIFNSNAKTILMIDEPENSLHVAWQSKMLEDFIEMTNVTGCQIILATHSPTFIDGRWDLTTDLYRQYREKFPANE